jgi:putative zinc finger protein
MTADPYARFDAAYLLGALDPDERLSFEAHLLVCQRCRVSLAEISAIPPMLAGLDESAFATPPALPAAASPATSDPLPRLLQAAVRKRTRRRRLTAALALVAAASAVALIVSILPSSSSGPKLAPRAMVALTATSVRATVALQPESWGTEIHLTCWYPPGAVESASEAYELVAHSQNGATYDLGSWRLAPGGKVIFSSGTALTEAQLKNLQITETSGRAILALSGR